MCLICERINEIHEGTNPYFVRELETGYVVLGDHQHFRGYTLFLGKQHVSEIFHLDSNEKLKFLEEMSLVAEAVARAFKPEKMNYELLGNGESHIHWHLFPRMSGDLSGHGHRGKGPVWWLPMELMSSEATRPTDVELEELRAALSQQLDELL